MANFEIIPFSIDHYDDVLALWNQCEGIGLSHSDSRENIQSYLERNPGMSLVALFERKLIGVILAGTDGRRGYLNHLAVHPDYRKNGIGRLLVDRCLKVLANAGIQKCHLFVFSDNHNGHEFWKKIRWTYRTDMGIMSKIIE